MGYNSANGRLETATSGNYTATYSYVANSPLVGQIVFLNIGMKHCANQTTSAIRWP